MNSTSIGAGRVVQSYPPAPMSSYLLDTTSNASVTYGQGKYVASASTERSSPVYYAWGAFNKSNLAATEWESDPGAGYVSNSGAFGAYTGSVRTVDTLGNSYAGEWLQIQMPVSVVLSNYTMVIGGLGYGPAAWVILGSRDGINWTRVDGQTNWTWAAGTIYTFTVGATQAYNYYRMVGLSISSVGYGYTALGMTEWTLNGTEEALCVTSDSKVGVGIANPQRALEVAGDLVVGGTVSAGNPLMYRNRVINGDMRIAQRGTSNVLSLGSDIKNYMIDRFFAQSYFTTAAAMTQYQSALSASDAPYQLGLRNYMNVVVNIGSSVTALLPISQVFEGYNIQDLNWGTSFGSPVTLSFWFRSNAPAGSQFTYSLINYAGTANYAGTFVPAPGIWQYWTFTIPPPQNGTAWNTGTNGALALYIASYYPGGFTTTVNQWNSGSYTYCAYGSYNWPGLAGNYIHCTGVQLEKGTVATPFEVRPYATELALCQRYYVRFTGDGSFKPIGVATAISTTAATGIIVAPTSMRTQVLTIDISSSSNTCAYTSSMIQGTTTHTTNDVYLYSAGTNFGFTTIGGTGNGMASSSWHLIGINLSNGSGLTAGWSGMYYIPQGKYIGFSAEL